jgi:coenzyme F420 hydrogenase subunit beta
MSQKSFEDLIAEVHEEGICQMCGGCVSFCSSAEFDVISFKDPHSPPKYINKENCLECGICYLICPQTHELDGELNQTYEIMDSFQELLGNYRGMYSCQATDEEFLQHGTDGGVVNSIINFLINRKMIDGSIVSKSESPFSREATLARNKKELLDASGTQLTISYQITEVSKISTYTHSIQELSRFKTNKLAIVGTPCQIYTVRCMQNLGVTPSDHVEICLGLFCYENFIFEPSQRRKFELEFNIDFKHISKLNIKEDVIINVKQKNSKSNTIHIPFNHLDEYVRPACKACNDFTNLYADLSFGGLGSPQDYTTVLVRTEKGERIFKQALNAGIIEALELEDSEKKKMVDIISQFAEKKKMRKEQFISN